METERSQASKQQVVDEIDIRARQSIDGMKGLIEPQEQHQSLWFAAYLHACMLERIMHWELRNATKPNLIVWGIEILSPSKITSIINWIDFCGLGFLWNKRDFGAKTTTVVLINRSELQFRYPTVLWRAVLHCAVLCIAISFRTMVLSDFDSIEAGHKPTD